MTTGRFVIAAAAGLLGAAACLALAAVLDSALLAVAGSLLVLGVLAARTTWMWRGRGREWLAFAGVLLAVIVVAFAAGLLGP